MPSEAIDSSLDAPKPEPGMPEVKVDAPKPAEPKHTETAKVAKPHSQAKSPAKTKAVTSRAAKKKHPDPKHVVKKTTPKPHPGTTTTGQ